MCSGICGSSESVLDPAGLRRSTSCTQISHIQASGLIVYLGLDSVRDKECLASDVLALQRVPHINKALGTTTIALLCKNVYFLVFWLGTWLSALL